MHATFQRNDWYSISFNFPTKLIGILSFSHNVSGGTFNVYQVRISGNNAQFYIMQNSSPSGTVTISAIGY